ncbi:MAG: hypothetical protein M3Y08_05400 [Fibrobacterota bacterium]|nr:hypothetical protein [Fibrobacterota bacterium]
MAEPIKEDVEEVDKKEDKLPALNTPMAWMKITGVLALLILINITVFLVSFGVGVIVTIPLTLFLAFLMIRDIVPRHRFPPGRPRQGNPS